MSIVKVKLIYESSTSVLFMIAFFLLFAASIQIQIKFWNLNCILISVQFWIAYNHLYKYENPSAKYWGITVDMSLYGNTKDKRLVSFQKQPLCDIVLFPLFPLLKYKKTCILPRAKTTICNMLQWQIPKQQWASLLDLFFVYAKSFV